MRVLQLIGGYLVLIFGYGFWLDAWLWDVSLGPTFEPTDQYPSYAILFLLFVLPGLMVAIGAYLQTVYSRNWALALVVIGAVVAAGFVWKMLLLYVYVGSNWRVRAVIVNLLAIALTVALGITNAIVLSVLKRLIAKPFSNDVSNKSLDVSAL